MTAHAALLVFMLCTPAECEPGEVRAASCQIAERYVAAGLRTGQRLVVISCTEEG